MNAAGQFASRLLLFAQWAQHAVLSFFRWLELVDQVRRERHLLAQMSDRHLSDMGIDRATADHESTRSAFDLPRWRLRQKL